MGKTMQNFTEQTHTLGLYDPQFEHDACGIGAVVDIKGRKSHQTVDDALRIVERLEHRAGKDAEGTLCMLALPFMEKSIPGKIWRNERKMRFADQCDKIKEEVRYAGSCIWR